MPSQDCEDVGEMGIELDTTGLVHLFEGYGYLALGVLLLLAAAGGAGSAVRRALHEAESPTARCLRAVATIVAPRPARGPIRPSPENPNPPE